MAKYSDEIKFKIALEFVDGHLSYRTLAKKFAIPRETPILQCIRAYKEYGEARLRRKHTKEVYSVQFKLDVLHFIKQTGASNQDTAIEFKLYNPTLKQKLAG